MNGTRPIALTTLWDVTFAPITTGRRSPVRGARLGKHRAQVPRPIERSDRVIVLYLGCFGGRTLPQAFESVGSDTKDCPDRQLDWSSDVNTATQVQLECFICLSYEDDYFYNTRFMAQTESKASTTGF